MAVNNLGLLRCRLEEYASASESCEQALAIQSQLVEETPDNPEHLSGLGGIYNNLGTARLKLSDAEQANAAFSSAIRYQQQAVELAPHVNRFHEFLTKHQTNLQRVNAKVDYESP